MARGATQLRRKNRPAHRLMFRGLDRAIAHEVSGRSLREVAYRRYSPVLTRIRLIACWTRCESEAGDRNRGAWQAPAVGRDLNPLVKDCDVFRRAIRPVTSVTGSVLAIGLLDFKSA